MSSLLFYSPVRREVIVLGKQPLLLHRAVNLRLHELFVLLPSEVIALALNSRSQCRVKYWEW